MINAWFKQQTFPALTNNTAEEKETLFSTRNWKKKKSLLLERFVSMVISSLIQVEINIYVMGLSGGDKNIIAF